MDIDIKNICSGFSYCVSILDTLFVWHGCGSTTAERTAAMAYAETLTSSPDGITVLIENENDDDEMFWMVLGEDAEYAKADYWRWRSSIEYTPRIWSVDAGRKDAVYICISRSPSSHSLNVTCRYPRCSHSTKKRSGTPQFILWTVRSNFSFWCHLVHGERGEISIWLSRSLWFVSSSLVADIIPIFCLGCHEPSCFRPALQTNHTRFDSTLSNTGRFANPVSRYRGRLSCQWQQCFAAT